MTLVASAGLLLHHAASTTVAVALTRTIHTDHGIAVARATLRVAPPYPHSLHPATTAARPRSPKASPQPLIRGSTAQ